MDQREIERYLDKIEQLERERDLLRKRFEEVQNLFESANISIWYEDLSILYWRLEKLRHQGVISLKEHLNNTPALIDQLINDVRVIDVNQATLKMFDADSKEHFLSSIGNTFGSGAKEIFLDELEAIWNRKESFSCEVNYRTVKGAEFTGLISMKLPKDDREAKRISVSIIDISPQKKGEQQLRDQEQLLRQIADNFPNTYIAIIDQDFCVGFAAGEGFWKRGVDPDQFVGLNIKKIFQPRHYNIIIEHYRATFRGERRQFELFQEPEHQLFRTVPIQRENGEIKRILVVVENVTEQRKQEREKRHLEEILYHKSKLDAIGQLAGGVAHDINNMLGGIMGAAQLLKSPVIEMNPRGDKYLDVIMKTVTRAAELTSKLLAFGQTGASVLMVVDFYNILDDTITILKRSVDKRIEINVEKNAGSHLVKGDQLALQNVLLNLGINAAQAIPDRGTITITIENIVIQKREDSLQLDPGNHLLITIEDNGVGISKKYFKEIFNPFFTTRKLGEGSGLGLSVAYGIIKDHNGAIVARSEEGAGSSFQIYLPCCTEHRITLEEGRIVPGGGTILLIDDEEVIRMMVGDMLREMGYGVLFGGNGREGVRVFQAAYQKIDCVILDMVMPEMNGEETFLKLKEIDPGVKVIVASGFTTEDAIKRMRSQGLQGYIKKPFQKEALQHMIEQILSEGDEGGV